MNVRLLIDGIIRQTTVLVAQLSTAAGVRAPLARVADQVFLDLAKEIEAQGVSRKVVADMFGMALRSYQKKMQRLSESSTEREQTLWQAILEFVRDGSKTRMRIIDRFHYDGEREVAAVLNDLVSSGLVYCTGRGDTAVYGLTSEADLHAVVGGQDLRSVEHVAWLLVFRGEASSADELTARLGVDPAVLGAAVEGLLADGRLTREENGALSAANVVIPVGSADGWEAAILDHFRAVATAIAAKATAGVGSRATDRVGGATLTFTIYPGHPHEARVRELLQTVRADVNALWKEVSTYNETHPVPEDATQVTFYLGQMVTANDDESSRGASDSPAAT